LSGAYRHPTNRFPGKDYYNDLKAGDGNTGELPSKAARTIHERHGHASICWNKSRFPCRTVDALIA
jgi:hypothetical protein